MADRPILFSSPMIRALLAGTKAQTRRLLTPRNTLFDGGRWPNYLGEDAFHWDRAWIDLGPSPAGNPGPYLKLPVTNIAMQPGSREETVHRVYPVVQPGDRLWVREGFSFWADAESARAAQWLEETDDPCIWRADFKDGAASEPMGGSGWRPSIHMPRWASRLTLTVTEVRVQRLQEISEAAALAEEVTNQDVGGALGFYSRRWTSLHGPGSWEDNPWVVAVSFDVRKGNIDGR